MMLKRMFIVSALVVTLSNLVALEPLGYLNGILNYGAVRDETGKTIRPGAADRALLSRLEAHIRELSRETENAVHMASYYQVEEGSLTLLIDLMQEIRSISLAGNDAFLNADNREIIKNEMDQYYRELFAVMKNTAINKIYIYRALLESGAFQDHFYSQNVYRTDYIDQLIGLLIYRRTQAGIKLKLLEGWIKSSTVSGQNARDFQNLTGEMKKTHLLFLAELLQLF